MAGPAGIEPASSGFSDQRSDLVRATPAGLEPATSGVTGRRAALLRYGAIGATERTRTSNPLPGARFPSGAITIITLLHLETRHDHFHTISSAATAQKAGIGTGVSGIGRAQRQSIRFVHGYPWTR